MAFPWDQAWLDRLMKMWADGYSASQIAEAFGGGVTRNAIIGKVHRLGLEKRTEARPGAGRPKTKPANTKRPLSADHGPRQRPRKTFFDLTAAFPKPSPELACTIDALKLRSCRFITDDPRNYDAAIYCGAETASPECSYCEYHASICYRPSRYSAFARTLELA